MSTTTNQPTGQSNTAACPECAAGVTFTRAPLQGEVIRCRECTAELEVTGTSPIVLTVAPEVEEDWGE